MDVYQKVDNAWVLAGSLNVPLTSDSTDAFATTPHTTLDLSGLNIFSRHVRVSLRANPSGRWVFVDEVTFVPPAVASVTTDAEGRFSLSTGTQALDPQVKASTIFGSQPVEALSPIFVPVRGGITDVGDLVLGANGRRAIDPIQARHLAYEAREQNAYKTLDNNYRWDFFTYYGNVQSGTNYGFNNAQYLLLNGSY